MHVWSPPPRPARRTLVPKPKTKKRNYQAVVDSSEKPRSNQGVKKQSGGSTSGKVSNRSAATENEKPKRSVRKASSTLGKDPLRTESDKAKQKSRKSRSASKEEVKEEKPRPSLKRSSLSNTSLKVTTRKSAEKKKDAVQIEPEVKVSDIVEVGEDVESAEKEKDTADSVPVAPEANVLDVLEEGKRDAVESATKEKHTADSTQMKPQVRVSEVLKVKDAVESAEEEKDTADSVQIEPEVKEVSDVLEGGGGDGVVSAEKEKDTTDVVAKELDVEEKEKSPEEDELRTTETNDKGEEDLKCSDVKVSSGNASDNSKPSERRVSLHANDEGSTHSGRKTPSYMAPTASTLRRHSLPSPANGKPGVTTTTTTTTTPRANKLLLASAKGSINGDKSVSSSKTKSGMQD